VLVNTMYLFGRSEDWVVKMATVLSFETSGTVYYSTRRNMPGDYSCIAVVHWAVTSSSRETSLSAGQSARYHSPEEQSLNIHCRYERKF